MVMKLHTGVPGAGKTYLLVKSFIDMFCRWEKETGRFVLKDEHKDIVLISNIEGLKLQHLDIESLMNDRCMVLARQKVFEKVGSLDGFEDLVNQYYHEFLNEKVRWFFNYDHQLQLSREHGPLVYLIEESQRYFDSKELGRQAWVRDVLYFFEKHRHMGFSIFCDTQHISKIHKGIAVLFETEIQAKPRTLSLMSEFKYNELADGLKTNQLPIVVRPDKRIFETYKSMSHKELVKTKKPAAKIFLFVAAAAIGSFFLLQYALANLGPEKKIIAPPSSNTPQISKVSRPSSVNVSELPQPNNKYNSTSGRWVHLPHVMAGSSITVVHPITNAIMPLQEFDLPVMRQGTQLYCLLSE